MNGYYTVRDVARVLDSSVAVIRDYIRCGIIKAEKVGRAYLISVDTYNRILSGKLSGKLSLKHYPRYPRKLNGTRKIDCVHYDTCLLIAARADAPSLLCLECDKYKQKPIAYELPECY